MIEIREVVSGRAIMADGQEWDITHQGEELASLYRYDYDFDAPVITVGRLPKPERDWGEETA